MQELMRYVRWGADDDARLAAFHRVAAEHFPAISDEFYERIREHADAHAVFTGEEQILRLQRSLVRWMNRLCVGKRDEAYFGETAQVGRVHVKVGLPQRYVFTAMALIQSAFMRIASREMGEASAAACETIARALDLELAIMLDTYHEDFVARVRRIDRLEQESLGRAVAQSERYHVTAVELASYLVVGLDEFGAILLFNRAAEESTGLGRDEALGRPFLEVLVAEEARSSLAAELSSAIVGLRTDHVFDAPLVTKAGRTRLVRWQIASARGAESDQIGALAVGRDVTEEAALAERTRQSEKLAAVGTLAAGLAHEIRNPLNGAHLHVTFLERSLRKSGADAESLDAVRVVGHEIKRLSVLVTEFLDFARPKPLERQRVSVRSLFERVAAVAAADAESAHVAVQVDLPTTELVLEVDPAKIEQVLLNLVQNGIEAMAPSGRGTATMRARRLPMAAMIEVEDDGPGIPGTGAPIFDAFYTTKPTGTGLGLAIVHRVVTDHGGTIGYESRPGRTVFRATLPIEVPR